MKKLAILLYLALSWHAHPQLAVSPYPDRFAWVFGWNLNSYSNLREMTQVLDAAGKAGLNGAVSSLGMDTLCKQSTEWFRRLETFQAACRSNHMEFIPAIFSIGYGGGLLAHDRNLAEGLPVKDALFKVEGSKARLAENSAPFTNGGFEDYAGNKARGYQLQDDPGRVTFIDTETKHSGNASIRLENFQAQSAGNGRVMQTVQVRPHRCYRVTMWVKTDSLKPGFRTTVLAAGRELAPREFNVPATADWRKVTYLFNSLENETVSIYAGVWGGRNGRLWVDDWSVAEIGPVNVLRRPGAPVAVRSEDGAVLFQEGRDYSALQESGPQPYEDDHEALALKILPGGRIKGGSLLRVSWYHSMLIHDSQVTVCMAEPALDAIFDHEARLLAERVRPSRVFLNMDEVRMGGTCETCRERNMAELLGNCVKRQVAALRKYSPGLQIYIWSDMFDPNHNARPNYYLVKGDYTGSWTHIPKDLVITVWGGQPRPESLEFFAGKGFETLIGCYYDASDLGYVRHWLELAGKTKAVRGLMYTPWLKKYELLPEFGDLLRAKN